MASVWNERIENGNHNSPYSNEFCFFFSLCFYSPIIIWKEKFSFWLFRLYFILLDRLNRKWLVLKLHRWTIKASKLRTAHICLILDVIAMCMWVCHKRIQRNEFTYRASIYRQGVRETHNDEKNLFLELEHVSALPRWCLDDPLQTSMPYFFALICSLELLLHPAHFGYCRFFGFVPFISHRKIIPT